MGDWRARGGARRRAHDRCAVGGAWSTRQSAIGSTAKRVASGRTAGVRWAHVGLVVGSDGATGRRGNMATGRHGDGATGRRGEDNRAVARRRGLLGIVGGFPSPVIVPKIDREGKGPNT